jgi:hypothetical protein
MTTTNTKTIAAASILLCIAAAFVAGRYSAPTPEPVAAKACASKPTLASIWKPNHSEPKPQPRVPIRPVILPPLELAQVENDGAVDELRKYEQKQSEDLVRLLRTRLKRIVIAFGRDDVPPEPLVLQMSEYMAGWVDALIRTAPTLADDLAHEVETAMCDPESTDAEVMLLSRLGQHMPELTSADAIECVLANHTREDMVLWDALDTLRASGLPAPKALADVKARAQDERTQRRIRAFEEGASEELRRAADGSGSVTEYQVPRAAQASAQTGEEQAVPEMTN